VVKALPAESRSGLLAYLGTLKRESHFDAGLTRAVLLASAGDHDQALAALVDAYHSRPHTRWRPFFSWYQLTDTAEWLYKETGDERFLKHALQWAKAYQEIQPQFGWAYAFEAVYSKDRNARIEAAGYASYLDAGSAWLQQVPEDIREQGRKWWSENSPYEQIKKDLIKQPADEKSA
jgi:hypothetical protein